MANEIKVRFSASGLREILADLEKGGQTGDSAFNKIATAIDKPNKALILGQHELETYRQAMVAAGDTGSRTFARIDQLTRQGNPWLLGLDKARAQMGTAVEGMAAEAGQGGAVLAAMGPGGLAAAAGIGVATVAVGKLTAQIQEYGQEAETLLRVARAVGLTTDELQAWRHVGDEFAVSTQTMDTALLQLNQSLGAVKIGGRGTAQILQAFQAAVIGREQVLGFKTAGDAIYAIAKGLQGLDDASAARVLERLRIPTDAIAAFKQAPDDLRRIHDEAAALGFVLDNSTVKSLAESNRQLRDSNEIIRNQLAGAFAPLDRGIATSMLNLASYVRVLTGWIGGVKGLIKAGGEAAANVLPGGGLVAGLLGGELSTFDKRQGRNPLINLWGRDFNARAPTAAAPSAAAPGGARSAYTNPEQAAALEKLNGLLAQYVTQTRARAAAEQQIKAIEETGVKVSDAQRKAILAAAEAEDKASAAAKARAAAAPGLKAAQEQAQAEQQLDALAARYIDHTREETAVQQALAAAVKAGGAAKAEAHRIGDQLLAAARANDEAAALRRAEQATKAQLDWNAALTGFTVDTKEAQAAEEAIARAIQAGLKPTEAQAVAVRALAAARDQAAAAARALQAASPYLSDAMQTVQAGLPDARTASGRFDPALALRQWQSARADIMAEARRKIAEDEARAIADGTRTRIDAERDAQERIRGLDLAYAVQNVQVVADIQRQALKERVAREQQATEDMKAAFLQAGDGVVDALRQFETDGNWSDLGKNIGKAVMGGLLDALINDPIRNLIHNAIDSLFQSAQGGGGGILGTLLRLGGLATSFVGGGVDLQGPLSGLTDVTSGLSSTSVPNLSIVPSFAAGVQDFGGGLAMVHANELAYLPRGTDVLDRAATRRLLGAMTGGGGGGAGGGSSFSLGGISMPISLDATGADPAELRRTQAELADMQKAMPSAIGQMVYAILRRERLVR